MPKSFKSPLRRLFCLLLSFVMFVSTGCAAARGPRMSAEGDAIALSAHGKAGKGLKTTGRAEARAAAWIFVGIVITAVVVVDLLILPATYEDPFPCCRAVVTVCD